MKRPAALRWATMLLAASLLASCSPWRRVYSEEEPGVNLYRYHTYNWLETPDKGPGNAGPDWLSISTQSKIRAAIEGQMGRFGFQICTDRPDLVLHYHVAVKNETFYVHDNGCDPRQPGDFRPCNRVRPVQYQEGTLIVDFIDTRDGNQVWRGAVVGALEELRPDEVDAKIKAAVAAIFKKFPERPLRVAML